MTNGKCPYHQDLLHSLEHLESRMTRLEVGIVTLFGAIIIVLGSTLWSVLDLPGKLKTDRDASMLKVLSEIQQSHLTMIDELKKKHIE